MTADVPRATAILLVALGGAAGSVCRYLAATAVQRWAATLAFPWGTFTVNVVGCLAIGLLAGLAESRGVVGAPARLLLVTGFLGGFTTFSSFGLETFELLRDGMLGGALANALGQLLLGTLAVAAGYLATRP